VTDKLTTSAKNRAAPLRHGAVYGPLLRAHDGSEASRAGIRAILLASGPAPRDLVQRADDPAVRKPASPDPATAARKPDATKKLDSETLRVIAAIALAETDPTRTGAQEVDVAWIYYNRWIEAEGRASGFLASMAYKNTDGNGLFMIWSVALGDDTHARKTAGEAKEITRLNREIEADNKKKGLDTPTVNDIAGYVKHLGLARAAADRLAKIKRALDAPEKNPYPGWTLQGSRDDIDRDKDHWPMVRDYIRKRLRDRSLPLHFKVLPARDVRNYTVIANLKAIAAFYGKDRPKKVDKLSDQEMHDAAELEAKAPPYEGSNQVRPKGREDTASTRARCQGGSVVPGDVEERIEQSRGRGRPIEDGMRERMERAFDADFAQVQLHTDGPSDALNRALGARAFTTRHDIFFRAGEYDPQRSDARELLAHELTHVMQQARGVRAKLVVGVADDAYEREADEVADKVMRATHEPVLHDAPAQQLLRQSAPAEAPAAETPAAEAPKPWPEVKDSKEPIALGKTTQDIEQIVGGGRYAQRKDTTRGVAMLLLPVFRELANNDFKGLEYEPEVGVPQAVFSDNVRKVREALIAQLEQRTKRLEDDRVAQEVKKILAEAAQKEKAATPQETKQREKDLAGAVRTRIEADPEAMRSIAEQAREETAQHLARESAAPMCFFLSSYIYFRAIDRVDASVSFAAWYKTQLLRGHVGTTTSGGLAWGKARGSPAETAGLQDYAKLQDIPAAVRLAISQQTYGAGKHFLLVFKDGAGVWRNLDHVAATGPWHGEPVDAGLVLRLWCVPTMTAAARPASPAPPAQPTAPSPPIVATAEEQRLMQCFEGGPSFEEGQSSPETDADLMR
jgi:hypothetical protein